MTSPRRSAHHPIPPLPPSSQAIREEIAEELTKSAEIETEVLRLEELTAKSMDGGAEVRMRSSLAEAKKLKAQLELEVER